jgi:hypothetical protein
VTAAIALTKSLTATATLGRISSAYPTGRPVLESFIAPMIIYPRPIPERRDGTAPDEIAAYRLGLHACFWDKYVAGEVFDPRVSVIGGAYPYRMWLTNETVDAVSASTGITTASFPEDENAGSNLYYLRLYHAGFTAPSGGTKVLGYTINIMDCTGATTSVDVETTIYARDHASILSHFRYYQPDLGSGGTGTPDDPFGTWTGLVGTDFNVAQTTTAIIVLVGGGSFTAPDITNNTLANWWNIAGGKRPRQIIRPRGETVWMDCTTQGGIYVASATSDILFHNVELRNGVHKTALQMPSQSYRVTVHDCTFKTWDVQAGAGENIAPIYPNNASEVYHQSFCGNTCDDVKDTAGVNSVNGAALVTTFTPHESLIANNQYINRTTYIGSFIRAKHGSVDLEIRGNTSLDTGQNYTAQGCLVFSTGGGTNVHERAVVRNNNTHSTTGGANGAFAVTASTSPSNHSVRVIANSFVGRVSCEAQAGGTLMARRNLSQNPQGATNAGFGTLDTDWAAIEGSIVDDCFGATSGLLNTDGTPVDTAYTGQYGHTMGV